MGAYYLDTSALVKRYARETGTTWVTRLTDPDAHQDIYTVILTGAELIGALFRKVRTGELMATTADRAAGVFKMEWQTHYQIVEVDASMVDHAMNLVEQHGLRGYDAVHLAAALRIAAVRDAIGLARLAFISADSAQLSAAAAAGLVVKNPNDAS